MRLLLLFLAGLTAIFAKNVTINKWQDLAYLEDFTFDFLKDGVYGDGSANEVNSCLISLSCYGLKRYTVYPPA